MPARTVTALATLAAAGAAGAGAAAVADQPASGAATPQKITSERVGGVHLGDRHRTLRARGLVGPMGPGCELAENTRSARLRAPLKGAVHYTTRPNRPRRVADITVTGGAAARGVGIGARARAIRRKFPDATFDHTTDSVFRLTLVTAPKRSGGPRLQFAVSTKTHRVELIGLPIIAFCE
jgi:hypothetical protein